MPSASEPSRANLVAPASAEPAPGIDAATAPRAWWDFPVGLLILCACLEAGEWLKYALGLILPGNMLGLFILLVLLGAGAVPVRWVEGAARWLLWLLPFLFIPIFVYALHNRDFWLSDRGAFAIVVAVATIALWATVGHLAQWTLRRHTTPEDRAS